MGNHGEKHFSSAITTTSKGTRLIGPNVSIVSDMSCLAKVMAYCLSGRCKILPWEEVAIDSIGPSRVKVNNRKVEFNALTCIDTAFDLDKLIRIDNKTSCRTWDKFIQSWLSCYLHPIHCVQNEGSEFFGGTFQCFSIAFDFKDVQSTAKNP